MPRFFFRYHDQNEVLLDLKGEEHPDLDAARREARRAASEIHADIISSGGTVSKQAAFEITNEAGMLLAWVPILTSLLH
ncbi:MAG TPA: hypothetical protein VGO70_11640 [Arsenicitalea sp.]|jgi:predicted ATPase|nr:hypothetical protein [Arsenicitalea sp.]